ncbi:MAG: hypothetical protein VKK97_12055 [Synechococcaceae cyanobacterium]|nr:hypothetical protein [Synechococcaceae cyanobacterium]
MADASRDQRKEHRDRDSSAGGSASSLLLGLLGGTVLGAVGLGWWLLSETERRRRRQSLPSSLSAAQGRPVDVEGPIELPQRLGNNHQQNGGPALQERVQQLNQAIDEVRRQLEALQPLP